MISLLAHGALGIFDELIYLIPTILFIISMGLSWLRSQHVRQESPALTDHLSSQAQPEDQPDDEDKRHILQ